MLCSSTETSTVWTTQGAPYSAGGARSGRLREEKRKWLSGLGVEGLIGVREHGKRRGLQT